MSLVLALDALESVKRFAHSSLLWQQLSRHVAALEATPRQSLIEAIANLSLPAGPAEWLRCSALADLTQDTVWYARQAQQADATTLPDAIFSLLGLVWHHALARTHDRTAMVDCLRSIDLPRLQRLVAGQLVERPVKVRPRSSGPLRVAVYTPQIANPAHGGTLFSLNMMSVLDESLACIATFSAQENNIPAVASYHAGNESLKPIDALPASLQLQRPGQARILLADVNLSVRGRLEQIQDAIDEFAPDLILFVGFFSPLVFHLQRRYPVLGLSVHALAPLAPVDVWLAADPHSDAACWPGLPVPQRMDFAYRFWPAPPFEPLARTALGLPASATVLISVGYRLQSELTGEWHQHMLALLERHPQVHWLLLGVVDDVPSDALPQHARIYRTPPKPAIEPWLAMSDIFINPPRVGGGAAVARAMELGVAVLSLADGDGGDKLGPLAAASAADYFSRLDEWIHQPARRQEAARAQQARFGQHLDLSGPQAARQLVAACHQAIEAFHRRQPPPG